MKLLIIDIQRNSGFLTLVGFSCTVFVTWEGTLL